MNSFESWWYRPDAITGQSMFDLHGIPTGLSRLCFKAGEFSSTQQNSSSNLEREVVSAPGAAIKVTRISPRENLRQTRVDSALRTLALVPDTRPICSADGCSERESCGSYCRDNGNFK